MRFVVMAATIVVLAALGARAQDAEIRGVIAKQFQSFELDDFATAFTFASPKLQSFFQTPDNFGRMIAQGYSMVLGPSAVEYLGLRAEGEVYWQTVQITDDSGRFHLLEYQMLETQSGWRINGVQLMNLPAGSV